MLKGNERPDQKITQRKPVGRPADPKKAGYSLLTEKGNFEEVHHEEASTSSSASSSGHISSDEEDAVARHEQKAPNFDERVHFQQKKE